MIFASKITLVGIYVIKVKNRNTRRRQEIRSKSTIKKVECRQLTSLKIPCAFLCVEAIPFSESDARHGAH